MDISWRTISSNILSLIVGSFVSQFAAFLTLILIVRQVGPEQYGEYTSSITLITFSAIIYTLGLDVWLLREGGAFPEKLGRIAGSLLIIRICIGLVLLVFWYLATWFIPLSPSQIRLMRINVWVVWITSLVSILLITFKADLKSRLAALADISLNIAILIATLVMAFLGVRQIHQYINLRIILLAIELIVVVWISNRLYRLHLDRNMAIQIINDSRPYASSELLVMLYMRLDVLLVAYFTNSRLTGLYSSAISIMNILFLVPAAVSVVMVPLLSRQFQMDPQKAWKTAIRMVAMLGIVGLVLMISMTVGYDFVETLLGASYAQSKDIFRQLSPVVFLQSCSYGLSSILAANNLQAKRSLVQIVAVILDVSINIWLLPRMDVRAAVYAFIVSSLALVLGYAWVNYRHYHLMQRVNVNTGIAGKLG